MMVAGSLNAHGLTPASVTAPVWSAVAWVAVGAATPELGVRESLPDHPGDGNRQRQGDDGDERDDSGEVPALKGDARMGFSFSFGPGVRPMSAGKHAAPFGYRRGARSVSVGYRSR